MKVLFIFFWQGFLMFTQSFPLGTTVHIDLVSRAENCAVKTQFQLSIHMLHPFFSHAALCSWHGKLWVYFFAVALHKYWFFFFLSLCLLLFKTASHHILHWFSLWELQDLFYGQCRTWFTVDGGCVFAPVGWFVSRTKKLPDGAQHVGPRMGTWRRINVKFCGRTG